MTLIHWVMIMLGAGLLAAIVAYWLRNNAQAAAETRGPNTALEYRVACSAPDPGPVRRATLTSGTNIVRDHQGRVVQVQKFWPEEPAPAPQQGNEERLRAEVVDDLRRRSEERNGTTGQVPVIINNTFAPTNAPVFHGPASQEKEEGRPFGQRPIR